MGSICTTDEEEPGIDMSDRYEALSHAHTELYALYRHNKHLMACDQRFITKCIYTCNDIEAEKMITRICDGSPRPLWITQQVERTYIKQILLYFREEYNQNDQYIM